jgi:photosystem I subunit 10
MNTELLLSVVPQTVVWSAKIASIMISSNIFCIVAGRYSIQIKGVGPSIPLTGSFTNFTLPELIASTSLGHIVGSGIILGLTYVGLLN